MKKILFLGLLILLMTGCNATYNLEISEDGFKEETTILSNINDINNYYDNDIFTLKELYDIQSKTYYSAYFNEENFNFYEVDKKQDNIKYYDQSIINDNINYGLKYVGDFKENDIYRSRAINTCYKEVTFNKNDQIYTLVTNGKAECFDAYKLLNEVVINIKTTYRVIYSNADKVEDNTYTWVINRDNYQTKKINLTYTTSKTNFNYDPSTKPDEPAEPTTPTPEEPLKKDNKTSILTYIFTGTIVLVFLLGIFGFIKYKSIKSNK